MVYSLLRPVLLEDLDDDYTRWDDGWTYQSLANVRSAQFEHTILITEPFGAEMSQESGGELIV